MWCWGSNSGPMHTSQVLPLNYSSRPWTLFLSWFGCARVCVCKCVCVCLHVKAKSQYWVSFLITLLFWERVSCLTQSWRFGKICWPAIPRDSLVPFFLALRLQKSIITHNPFIWVLEFKLRSSRVRGKYLSTWTISWDDTTHFKQPKQRYKNWCPNSMSRHMHVGFYLYLQRHTNCQKDIHQFDRGHLRAKTTDNACLCIFSCTFKVFYKSFT